MLDFNCIKEIKLTDVLARYKIALRFKGDYAVCACPLPSHKKGDNTKSFSINLAGNYFRCFSDSCNANNGGKRGGDVINFVALMEGCREKDAAQKLADWYGVQNETPQHIAEASKEKPKTEPQKTYPESNGSGDSVKYTEKVRVWFDELWPRRDGESDLDWRKRVLRAVITELIRNYKSGKAGRTL
jgi:DNA primase